MEALWQSPNGEWLPLTAVRARMPGGQAGSHLQAALAMLCVKGHTKRRRPASSPAWAYRATVSKDEYLLARIIAVLKHSSDPQTLLCQASAQLPSPPAATAARDNSRAHPDPQEPEREGTARAQPGGPAGAAGRRPPPEWGAAG